MSNGVSKQSVEGMPVPITVVNRSGSQSPEAADLTGVAAVTVMAVAPTQYQAKGGKCVHLDSPTGALLGERAIRPHDQVRYLRVPLRRRRDCMTCISRSRIRREGRRVHVCVLTATFERR